MEKNSFADHMQDIVNYGMVAMALGMGYDLGLVKMLCEADQPVSLTEVAQSLNLKERYCREWLSAMVAAKVLQMDQDTRKYFVPQEHKQALQDRAAFAAGMPAFANRSMKTRECFKKDGPYGYGFDTCLDWFDWFNGYRDQICSNVVSHELIPKFRQQGLVDKLETGITVLDLGCGTGTYTLELAKHFPKSTFIGVEYAEKGLRMSKENAKKAALPNVSFEFGDAHNLPNKWKEYFDCVLVYDVLHDLPDPFQALREIYKVLKQDGCLNLVECGFHSDPVDNMGNSTAALYYSCSMFVCLPSSLSGESTVGYGACWGVEEIQKALAATNFKLQGELSIIGGTTTKAFLYCTK